MQQRFNEDYLNAQEETGGGDPLLVLPGTGRHA